VEGSKNGKFEFIRDLKSRRRSSLEMGTMTSSSERGWSRIAVLGDERMSASAMKNADIVVKSIFDALDLF